MSFVVVIINQNSLSELLLVLKDLPPSSFAFLLRLDQLDCSLIKMVGRRTGTGL